MCEGFLKFYSFFQIKPHRWIWINPTTACSSTHIASYTSIWAIAFIQIIYSMHFLMWYFYGMPSLFVIKDNTKTHTRAHTRLENSYVYNIEIVIYMITIWNLFDQGSNTLHNMCVNLLSERQLNILTANNKCGNYDKIVCIRWNGQKHFI